MELERPEDEPLPGDWKRMPEFDRLLLFRWVGWGEGHGIPCAVCSGAPQLRLDQLDAPIPVMQMVDITCYRVVLCCLSNFLHCRALRPDRLTSAMTKFVTSMIGAKYVQSQPYDLERSFMVREEAVLCFHGFRVQACCTHMTVNNAWAQNFHCDSWCVCPSHVLCLTLPGPAPSPLRTPPPRSPSLCSCPLVWTWRAQWRRSAASSTSRQTTVREGGRGAPCTCMLCSSLSAHAAMSHWHPLCMLQCKGCNCSLRQT
jgi:hypothetical protein